MCSVISNSLQPMDCISPGASVHGIFPARIPEWVAISFSRKGLEQRIQHETETEVDRVQALVNRSQES